MKSSMKLALTTAVILLGVHVPATAQPTGSSKCEAAKGKEAAKFGSCLAGARKKLLATAGACSVTTATACYNDAACPSGESCAKDDTAYVEKIYECLGKLSSKWAKLEAKAAASGSPCPTAGDVFDIAGLVGNQALRVGLALSGSDRFVDNQDGTISDRQTGLMWEKKIARDHTPNAGNLHDADNTYAWAGTCSVSGADCQPAGGAATCASGAENGNGSCVVCGAGAGTCSATDTVWTWIAALNAANYAGHSDWRVATRDELQAIADDAYGTDPAVDAVLNAPTCSGGCTDITDPACSCTRSGDYWTASHFVHVPTYAWYVSLGNSNSFVHAKTDTYYVRAVRSEF